MDPSNITLNTIQIISTVTYLQRLSNFMHLSYNLDVNDKNNSLAIINSFVNYLYINENNRNHLNFLTHWLLNDNIYFDIDNADEIQYSKYFKTILFNHIIGCVVFKNYGNVYGFMAEVYRHMKKKQQTMRIFVRNAKLKLKEINEVNSLGNFVLDEDAIEIILHRMIISQFPEHRRMLNLYSMDFIYAHAGFNLYNAELVEFHYNYSSTMKWGTQHIHHSDYRFDDCLEIGLAVHQLIMSGEIDRRAFRIFALPAIFYYIKTRRVELEQVEISEIVTNQNHWNEAYEMLFNKLKRFFSFSNTIMRRDAKYQYYLAVYNFKNYSTLAREEIVENCDLSIKEQLEVETEKYVKNPKNYTCSNDGRKLSPLDTLFKSKMNKFLYKYHNFASATDQENNSTNASAKHPLRVNSEIFADCKEVQDADMNKSNETLLAKLNKYFKERVHCFSLLYACTAGIVAGNEYNSTNNCPVKEAIRLQDIINRMFLGLHLTQEITRIMLASSGTSLRTLALRNSMVAILQPKELQKNRNLTNVGFSKSPEVDNACVLYDIFDANSLRSIQNLMNAIEKRFFISYKAVSRRIVMYF